MSAPERFQVGDTVRCVDDNNVDLRVGRTYTVTKVDGECGDVQVDGRRYWFSSSRFVLVSRPTPSALDPFAWTDLAGQMMGNPGIEFDLRIKSAPFITAWVAWSRFCYWAAQSNLAAHFLPTVAAARTRASNGRDVPVANPERALLAALLAIDAEHVKAHDVDGCALCWPGDGSWPCTTRMETDAALEALQELDACRRALGAS